MSVKEEKEDEQAHHIIDDQIDLPRSTDPDTVDENFRIHLNEPITELSNDFCKYYYATDPAEDTEYFAIVFENNFMHPIREIVDLAENHIDGINNIIAYSIVVLSITGAEHLVVIVKAYEPGNNLLNYVQQRGTISSTQAEEIVQLVADALEKLEDIGIYQCNINSLNIMMEDDQPAVIREFFNCLPSYYQSNPYLAPELLGTHRAARQHNSSKCEIYALAVTIFESLVGRRPWVDLNNDQEYNDLRLEKTTFKFLINKTKISEKMRTFFKACLHDDPFVRWNHANLIEWCNDKHTNLSKHDPISSNNNFLSFKDQNYSNLKSLAYAFFLSWESALKFTKDDKLYKWASREQVSNDILDGIREVVDLKSNNMVVANSLNSHNKMTKLLAIIDPAGPIRLMDFAIAPRSIPKFLHFLMVGMKKPQYEQVLKIINDKQWDNYKNKSSVGYLSRYLRKIFSRDAEKATLKSALTSIEKLVYSLNPNVRCNSKILENFYVTNMADLMVALDKYAERKPESFTLDRNIVAFIIARLGLKEDIKPAVLSNFPKMSEHPTIVTLSVMRLLEQHESEIKTPNILKSIQGELCELLEDNLHNKEFKQSVIESVKEAGKEGSYSDIIEVLSDQQKFIDDYNRFYEACKKVKNLEEKIKALKNSDVVFNSSVLLGQKMTVLASYILCLIVTVVVMF